MPIRRHLASPRVTAALAPVALGLLSVACSGDDPGRPGRPPSGPRRRPLPELRHVLRPPADRVAGFGGRSPDPGGLAVPAARAGRPARRRHALRGPEGRQGRRCPGGGGDPTTVLDLTGSVSAGGEQGLLGLAFSPTGAGSTSTTPTPPATPASPSTPSPTVVLIRGRPGSC